MDEAFYSPLYLPGLSHVQVTACDIIEFIAIRESAIVHILNAESEKIQAVINQPDTTAEQLLAVNHSVKNTVDTVIGLETALKAKLQMFQSAICQTS